MKQSALSCPTVIEQELMSAWIEVRSVGHLLNPYNIILCFKKQ